MKRKADRGVTGFLGAVSALLPLVARRDRLLTSIPWQRAFVYNDQVHSLPGGISASALTSPTSRRYERRQGHKITRPRLLKLLCGTPFVRVDHQRSGVARSTGSGFRRPKDHHPRPYPAGGPAIVAEWPPIVDQDHAVPGVVWRVVSQLPPGCLDFPQRVVELSRRAPCRLPSIKAAAGCLQLAQGLK
jgi:hypothetical protein